MLSFSATNDKRQLDEISESVFGKEFPGQIGYVLHLEGKPIGVAKVQADPEESHISMVGLLERYRGAGFGDFFTRSLMNVLSYVSKAIVIDYEDDYYLKFGFEKRDRSMYIESSKIVFPAKCREGK